MTLLVICWLDSLLGINLSSNTSQTWNSLPHYLLTVGLKPLSLESVFSHCFHPTTECSWRKIPLHSLVPGKTNLDPGNQWHHLRKGSPEAACQLPSLNFPTILVSNLFTTERLISIVTVTAPFAEHCQGNTGQLLTC